MLLPVELRGRLERLSLVARRRVRAQWAGRHGSQHKGESLDFADYREYVPGDDFRRIDHNLWARLGVLLVRRFEAEEELPVRVVLDRSRSMGFYSKHGLNVEVIKTIQIGGAYVTTIIKGDVGSVRAAVDAGSQAASKVGDLVSAHVIPRPTTGLMDNF